MPGMRKIALFGLCIAFLIVSCEVVKNGEMIEVTPPTTTTKSPQPSPPPQTPSLPLATKTPLLQPTILPTILPLPKDEAFALLFNMLHAGSKCELPCWLNIIPGQSSLSDAHVEWSSFLSRAGTTKRLPRDFLYYFDYTINNTDFFIDIIIFLSSDSEIIESIRIYTIVLSYVKIGSPDRISVYDSVDYKNVLQPYLLQSTLSTFGPPDQIVLSMDIARAEPTAPTSFYIWLLYPKRGAIVRYQGSAEITGNTVRGCPSDTFVDLWLVSPNDEALYNETLANATGTEWDGLNPVSPFYKPTLEGIGMSANDFFELFKKPTESCIESPLGIWPR